MCRHMNSVQRNWICTSATVSLPSAQECQRQHHPCIFCRVCALANRDRRTQKLQESERRKPTRNLKDISQKVIQGFLLIRVRLTPDGRCFRLPGQIVHHQRRRIPTSRVGQLPWGGVGPREGAAGQARQRPRQGVQLHRPAVVDQPPVPHLRRHRRHQRRVGQGPPARMGLGPCP